MLSIEGWERTLEIKHVPVSPKAGHEDEIPIRRQPTSRSAGADGEIVLGLVSEESMFKGRGQPAPTRIVWQWATLVTLTVPYLLTHSEISDPRFLS